MKQLTDDRGAEISWDETRFELRHRFDHVTLGFAIALTLASAAVVAAGALVPDHRTLVFGAWLCLAAHAVAYLWASMPAPAVRRLVATRTPRTLTLDAQVALANAIEVVVDPPKPGRLRVHVVALGRTSLIASARAEDATRVGDALAHVLGVTPRAATLSELTRARTSTRTTATLLIAATLELASVAALYAAVLVTRESDPELGRTIALVAGPLVVLSPVPYWALMRRLVSALEHPAQRVSR